jgi:hypothetical protein
MIIGDETEQYFHVIWKFHKLYLKKQNQWKVEIPLIKIACACRSPKLKSAIENGSET